jgi:hypothetical protein
MNSHYGTTVGHIVGCKASHQVHAVYMYYFTPYRYYAAGRGRRAQPGPHSPQILV